MRDNHRPAFRQIVRTGMLCAVAAGMVSLACGLMVSAPLAAPQQSPPAEATTEEVHRLCAACHAYPPPDTFPRAAWRREVKQGYDFFYDDPTYRFEYPPLDAVVRYYENRAPAALPPLPASASAHPSRVRFDRRDLHNPDVTGPPGVTHVTLAPLIGKDHLDVLVCDAMNRQVYSISPYVSPPNWKILARGLCCAHAEVVDLDGDGLKDIVLACLGSFYATDTRVGSVVWLRQSPAGTWTPHTLLDGVGRVADVQAADFTGDGKLDLVVAEFGWRRTGSILLLENQTTDWTKPRFTPKVLDPRHGTSHLQVADLNRDGKPDFVAAISQEHETVVAFLNEGAGRFRKETIFTAPHPAFGINGLQLVDLDRDGDIDVLLSNGDALDQPYVLKPYHGLTWLENRGGYPFTPHRLADCYGAGSPVAADFDGNGLLDIVCTVFLPQEGFPQRVPQGLESVVLLEQVAPGKFERYALERRTCDHLSCAAGDLDSDGRPELVIGNFIPGGHPGDALSVWHNETGKTRHSAR